MGDASYGSPEGGHTIYISMGHTMEESLTLRLHAHMRLRSQNLCPRDVPLRASVVSRGLMECKVYHLPSSHQCESNKIMSTLFKQNCSFVNLEVASVCVNQTAVTDVNRMFAFISFSL